MIDSEEALYLAKLEIFRLKDLLKRTECERDTVIANAFKRIEQLEEERDRIRQNYNDLLDHLAEGGI